MRTIKFRGWNKLNNTFDYWNSDSGDTGFWEIYGVLNDDFMQFTGLKDSKNREIYEGDLVLNRKCGDSYVKPAKVFFEKGSFEFTGSGCDSCDEYLGNYILGDFEVIGNIYEVPDLLK